MNNRSGEKSKRGRYIVFSSPSGGGKNSVINRLLEDGDFAYSISATSRKPRNGELNGQSYWFYSRDEFRARIDRNEFLEWEQVYHGEYYGTPRLFAEEAVYAGTHVLFDLDIKGALKFKENFPDSLLIFLLPPSLETLEERLRQRGTETEEQIQHRLAEVVTECNQAIFFDHAVVNDRFDDTIEKVKKIINTLIEEDER